jgi:IPT/TIG domain
VKQVATTRSRRKRPRSSLPGRLVLVAVAAAIAVPAGAQARTATALSATAASGPIAGVVRARPTGLNALGTLRTAAVSNLVYGGGPVMRTNRVYAIYWLPPGSSLGPSYRTIVDGYLQNVAASSGALDNVYSNMTQYHDTTGPIAHSSTFGGSYVDTANAIPTTCNADYALQGLSVSGCVSQADERAEIDRVLTATGWTPGSTTMFFLFTPQDVGSCASSGICAGTYFCAYHSMYTKTVSGHSQPVIWANEPYPDLEGTAGACDSGQHPNGDVADATVNLVSHEHIEAITDPDTQTGWFDASGQEIADKCAWRFGTSLGATESGSYNQTIGTGKYFLQQEWSNASGACVLRPGAAAPRVSSFSPASGPVGTTVTISGSALSGVTALAFNGTQASFTPVSAIQLRATVPAGATTGPISATSPNGSTASTSSFKVTPKITALSVPSGVVGDGVTITGTSLSGASSVVFGSAPDTSFTVDSDTQITAHVPDAARTAAVKVTTPMGTATSVTFGVRPTLDELATTSGLAGSTVTITGKTLTGTNRVTFGVAQATASIRSVTDSQVRVVVPSSAVTGPLTVTNAGGSTSTAQMFTVLPSLKSFSPSATVAGHSVTLSGTGLAGASDVSFNGTPAVVTRDTATSISAQVPAAATPGPITVTTPGGTVAAGTFKPLPALSGATPLPAQAGDALTLTGTNLVGAASLTLGGRPVAIVSVDSPTQITTGPLPDGAVTGSLRVVTSTGAGSMTLGVRPTLDPLALTDGTAGTVLTLTGKTFAGTKKVTFGSPAATASFKVVGNTQLQVTVPASALTGPVTVTNAGGATSSADTFTVLPKIASVTPGSGGANKIVKVKGSGLGSTLSVTFGGMPATSFTPVSATEVDATVPAGAASGKIEVTTPAGTATSTVTFAVTH